MARSNLRQQIRQLHLWMGLSLGALFVLLGLTGSALVFYQAIDRALHPEIQLAAPGPAPDWQSPVWDRALATLYAQWPQRHGTWRFEVTGEPGPIAARYMPGGMGHGAERHMIWLSPDGSQVLREAVWGDYAMTWIYELHMELLGGAVGQAIVGWSGLAILLLVLCTGVWAWWPRGSWAKALRFAPHAPPLRRLRDLHKLAGLIGLPLLLILVLTGVMLALPRQSNAALAPITGPVDKPLAVAAPPRHSPRMAIKPALAAAHAALPRARLVWIEIPPHGTGNYKLRMQQPGDPSPRFPHSFVHIDPVSGRVLGVEDAERAGATTTINNWLHPLHDGSIGGLGTRWLAFAAGLLPAFLFITGLLRWRRRRCAHR